MNNEEILKEMQEYAIANNVPIIEPEGLNILLELVKKENPKRILELGTAIGYSSAKMHFATGAEIYTIERDVRMYEKACENHEKLDIENKVKRIMADALLVDNQDFGLFDVIYIDAAKAQNIKFLEKYRPNLKTGGVVILDNLLFHGWVNTPMSEIKTRNLRQLVRKINDFLDYVKKHDDYDFTLLEEGDGIGIIRLKGDNDE